MDSACEAAAMQAQLDGMALTSHGGNSSAANCDRLAPDASPGPANSCQRLIDSTIGTSGRVDLSTQVNTVGGGSQPAAAAAAGAASAVGCSRGTTDHQGRPPETVWPHLVSVRIKPSMEVTAAFLGSMAAALLSRLQVSDGAKGGTIAVSPYRGVTCTLTRNSSD